MDDQILADVVYWFIYNMYELHFSSTGRVSNEVYWSIKKSMLPFCLRLKTQHQKEKLFCEKSKANRLSIPLFQIIGMYSFFHQILSLVEELDLQSLMQENLGWLCFPSFLCKILMK